MFAITIFGDSIVFGRGNAKDGGWVGRLKKEFEVKDYYNVVYNLGIPGDTSTNLLKRFDPECKPRIKFHRKGDRHILIIGIGINDSRLINNLPETNPKKFAENIQKLIQKAKKLTKEIVLIGLTPVNDEIARDYEGTFFSNERVKQYNDIIKSNCKKSDVLFIDVFKKIDQKYLDDGLHPNSKGYQKMYEIIKKLINF